MLEIIRVVLQLVIILYLVVIFKRLLDLEYKQDATEKYLEARARIDKEIDDTILHYFDEIELTLQKNKDNLEELRNNVKIDNKQLAHDIMRLQQEQITKKEIY